MSLKEDIGLARECFGTDMEPDGSVEAADRLIVILTPLSILNEEERIRVIGFLEAEVSDYEDRIATAERGSSVAYRAAIAERQHARRDLLPGLRAVIEALKAI